MKKFLSLILCVILLLGALPTVSWAKAVTGDVFIGFEDYESGVSTILYNSYLQLAFSEYETASLPNGDGKSIKMYSGDAVNYMNINTEITKNAVIGFSCLTNDSKTEFYVTPKNTDVSGFITFTGTAIKLGSTKISQPTLGEWSDFAFAFDYDNHKIYVYHNRELIGTKEIDETIVSTKYLNLNIRKNMYTDEPNAATDKKFASVYIDNVFAWYPDYKMTSSVSGESVDSDTTDEITFEFGQNVLIDDIENAVLLNGDSVEAEAVLSHGYATGIKLKNLSLEDDTSYEITFPGIKDFFGNSIEFTHSFKTASNEPSVSIQCENDGVEYSAGDEVKINISSANIGDSQIEIINNGEVVGTVASDAKSFSVILVGGANNIKAYVSDFETESNEIYIDAKSYDVIRKEKFFDFSDNLSIADLHTAVPAGGILDVRTSDSKHGKSLYFELDQTSEKKSSPYIITEFVTGIHGIYVYEAEFKFSQVVTGAGNFFAMKTNNDKSVVLFSMKEGQIRLNAGDKDVIYDGIEPNEWIKFKAMWDTENKTGAFYVNDVLAAKGVPMTDDFETVKYVNLAINSRNGTKTSMYMDNIRVSFIAPMHNVTASFNCEDVNNVPYESTMVELSFDQQIDTATLYDIKIVDDSGKEATVSFETDDNELFTAVLENLKPDTCYSIDLSNVKTKLGAGGNNKSISFKTSKLPFAVKNVDFLEIGDKVNIDVDIQNLNEEQKNYIIIAALYEDNMMVSSSAQSFSSAKAENAKFSLAKPLGEYTAEVYVFDSVESLNLIEKVVVK